LKLWPVTQLEHRRKQSLRRESNESSLKQLSIGWVLGSRTRTRRLASKCHEECEDSKVSELGMVFSIGIQLPQLA